MEIASRKIKEKYPEARIAALPAWWVTAGELLPPDTFEVWGGLGHAGEGESSLPTICFRSGANRSWRGVWCPIACPNISKSSGILRN